MPDQLNWLDQPQSYPNSPGYRPTETSKEAADVVRPHQSRLQQLVIDAITDRGPMTSHELAAYLHVDYASIQPRTAELKLKGKIIESGERRKAPGKKVSSAVWRLS